MPDDEHEDNAALDHEETPPPYSLGLQRVGTIRDSNDHGATHAEVANDGYYKEDMQLMKNLAPTNPKLRILEDALFTQPMEKSHG